MKKKVFSLVVVLLLSLCSVCHAVQYTYTLPYKISTQLQVGSGLTGSFRITAEGEKFNTPLMNAISDADISLMGIFSDSLFYGYLYQMDEQNQTSGVTELQRRDDVYYIRSDMVPGKILQIPTTANLLETLFPVKGENPSAIPFVSQLISLDDSTAGENWQTLLTRYQKELEFWLAEYAVLWQSVKKDSELTAEFSYRIPVSELKALIIKMMGEYTSDAELAEQLDKVMTQEQKSVYLNRNLLYFYEEALNSLDLQQELVINRQTSTLGQVVSSVIELPLDQKLTGFSLLTIDSHDGITAYTLKNDSQAYVIAITDSDQPEAVSYKRSVWYVQISNDQSFATDLLKTNYAARIDIEKTSEETDDGEQMRYQNDHYQISVIQDELYVPEEFSDAAMTSFDPISIELALQYSSKYAQNSSTTLDIKAKIEQSDSKLDFNGMVKTVRSDEWELNPFEIIDPVVLDLKGITSSASYLSDWISNAASIIRHSDLPDESADPSAEPAADTEKEESQDPDGETETEDDTGDDPETAPLEVSDGD